MAEPLVHLRGRARFTARSLLLTTLNRSMPYATATADGLVYVLPTDDDGPGRALFVGAGTPELAELHQVVELLRAHGDDPAGKVLVDIGANIGTTTVPAVCRHGFGRALAVEPDPENVALLRANVALNRADDRVDVVAAAASDEGGEQLFHPGVRTPRGRRTGAGRLARAATDGVQVRVVTVDAELAARGLEPNDVGLLWIDVQGHESHVLAAAATLLEASRPVVFAVRASKLARSGRRDDVVAAVRDHYRYVVDLRAGGEPRPAAEIAAVLGAARQTDLLAFGAR